MNNLRSVASRLAVLVVDDYREFTHLIRDILKPLGISKIDEATDGADALRRLREDDYSLVISDWNMAPMSGYQLLREVRADARLREVPFIMISGSAQSPQHILAAKAAGVTHFIAKPFRPATLIVKLREILGDIGP